MDYKYIEQLLERYWDCETSLEEEAILRSFFRQKELPSHLMRYKSLFAYEDAECNVKLGSDFDERVLAKIDRSATVPTVKARRLSMSKRLMPLFKAAAMLALLLVVGGVVKHSVMKNGGEVIYVYDQFDQRANDSQVAYEADTVKTSLKNVSNKIFDAE